MDPGITLEVEVPACVDAAVAVMTVERTLVAVLVGELADVAQIAAQTLGRNRRILPTLVCIRLAGDEGGRAQSGLSDIPHVCLLVLIVIELHVLRRALALLQSRHQLPGLLVSLVLRLAAELDEQEAVSVW